MHVAGRRATARQRTEAAGASTAGGDRLRFAGEEWRDRPQPADRGLVWYRAPPALAVRNRNARKAPGPSLRARNPVLPNPLRSPLGKVCPRSRPIRSSAHRHGSSSAHPYSGRHPRTHETRGSPESPWWSALRGCHADEGLRMQGPRNMDEQSREEESSPIASIPKEKGDEPFWLGETSCISGRLSAWLLDSIPQARFDARVTWPNKRGTRTDIIIVKRCDPRVYDGRPDRGNTFAKRPSACHQGPGFHGSCASPESMRSQRQSSGSPSEWAISSCTDNAFVRSPAHTLAYHRIPALRCSARM